MVNGAALSLILAGALTYFAALGIWHGVKKIPHGLKVVACAIHVAKCEKDVKK